MQNAFEILKSSKKYPITLILQNFPDLNKSGWYLELLLISPFTYTQQMIVELMDTAAKAIMGLALDGHIGGETSKSEATVNKLTPEEQIKIFQDLTNNFNELIEVSKRI